MAARILLGCCAVALVACSSGPPSVLPTPRNAGDCGSASDPGNPDGGMVAGLDWPGGGRKLGASARAYICVSASHSTGTLSTPPGVTIRPARFPLTQHGVVPVTVTVRRSGRATLWLQVVDSVGNVSVRRPVADVVADRSGWRFTTPSE